MLAPVTGAVNWKKNEEDRVLAISIIDARSLKMAEKQRWAALEKLTADPKKP